MTPFIITGMPRARTAWLANYLTTGKFRCFHDFIARSKTVEDAVDAMSGGEFGISDSGAVWFVRRIRELIPAARWVVIRRDPVKVRESFEFAAGFPVDITAHLEKVERACAIPGALVVEFPDIDERIREIATFCFPDWVHDEDRFRQLQDFNIQLTREALLRAALELETSLMEQADP